MTVLRNLIEITNAVLRPLNLRLDSLTAEKRRLAALDAAVQRGAFNKMTYPIPSAFLSKRYQEVLQQLEQHRVVFESWRSATNNPVGYEFANDFYSSPDAEVLYTLIRSLRP
jgi:hypothetical protein